MVLSERYVHFTCYLGIRLPSLVLRLVFSSLTRRISFLANMYPLYVLFIYKYLHMAHTVACDYQVFDNYAVTVMIGDDPYTLGLFDTAGKPL